MERYDAVGVSAPQIGVPLRIFAIQITEKQISGWSDGTIHQRNLKPIPCKFFINPELKIINSESVADREGCCSIYGYSAIVSRAKEVEVRAFDETGQPFTWSAKDWASRIVQHEIDHLNGVLFVDKLGIIGKLASRCALKELEEEFKYAQQRGEIPPETEIKALIDSLLSES